MGTIFLLFIIYFCTQQRINIHMTFNNNDNKQSEIITMSLFL